MATNASLLVSLVYALLLAGAGSFFVPVDADQTLVKRLCVRFFVGLAIVPILLIALFEIFGIRVRPASAIVFGCAGVLWMIAQEVKIRRAREELASAASEEEEDWSPYHLELLDDIVLLIVSAGVFLACFKGATFYPMMGGWDPWGHALGTRYLVDTGVLRQPDPEFPLIHYIDAYPPLFDVLLSIPAGILDSINAPIKAFNALIVAAVIPALYLLAKELTGDRTRAMIAALIYVVLPSNLTQHVWGHSVATLFTLAGLLCALRLRNSKAWVLPAALCFAGALLAAPTGGMKAGLVLILTAAAVFFMARDWFGRIIVAGVLALVVSMIWYAPVFIRYGMDPLTLKVAMDGPNARKQHKEQANSGAIGRSAKQHLEGSRLKQYSIDDFIFFRPYRFTTRLPITHPNDWKEIETADGKKVRAYNKRVSDVVPEGLGVPVILLALCSIGAWFARRRAGENSANFDWRVIAFVWFGFTLVGILGAYTGLVFFVWRFWLLLVPFAAILAADGLCWLAEAALASKLTRVIFVLITIAILLNAAAAIRFDFTDQFSFLRRTDRNLALGLPFVTVLIGAALWFVLESAARERTGTRAALWILAPVLLAHFVIALPLRIDRLTRPIKDLVFRWDARSYDTIGYEGYLRICDNNPSEQDGRRLTEPHDRVWPLSGAQRFQVINGLDRLAQPYLPGQWEFFRKFSKDPSSVSTDELIAWLRENRYDYVVLDPVYQLSVNQDTSPETGPFGERVQELRAKLGEPVYKQRKFIGGNYDDFYMFKVKQ